MSTRSRPRLARRLGHLSSGGLVAVSLLVALGGLGFAGILSWPFAETTKAGDATLREFTLTASEIDWEILPGTVVRAWAYNGQMPGPELRVHEGDRVRITLRNELPIGTTIHWHGGDVPPEIDGPVGLNQAAVEPGQSFVYEFIATNPGSRMYHSHADPTTQIALELYRTADRRATGAGSPVRPRVHLHAQ